MTVTSQYIQNKPKNKKQRKRGPRNNNIQRSSTQQQERKTKKIDAGNLLHFFFYIFGFLFKAAFFVETGSSATFFFKTRAFEVDATEVLVALPAVEDDGTRSSE